MTLDELRAWLEVRASEADALRAVAPLGDTLRFVLAELAGVNGNGLANPAPAPSPLLTVKAAAARLGKTPQWLYRRAKQLPFIKRVGPYDLMVDPDAMAKWLAKR